MATSIASSARVSEGSARVLLSSVACAVVLSALAGIALAIEIHLDQSGEHHWLSSTLTPIAILAAPGYLARIVCPFGGALFYLLPFFFNCLFFTSLIFGLWQLMRKIPGRARLHTAFGLTSTVGLFIFLAMFKEGYWRPLENWANPYLPAWPVLLAATALAVAATFRNSKGWIYLLPFVYITVLLYISAHRVYIA